MHTDAVPMNWVPKDVSGFVKGTANVPNWAQIQCGTGSDGA